MPIWLYIGLIGVSVLYFGGLTFSLVVGIPFTLLALFGLTSIVYSRVWVDDGVIYSRHVFGHRPPMRIDELRTAELTGFRRNQGPQLFLTTRDGTHLRLDGTNLRLTPLYRELAQHIPAGSPVANERLHKRMERARDGLGLPRG